MNLTKIGSNTMQIQFGAKIIFISYETPVAYLDMQTGEYFKTTRVFSPTTTRHIAKWLDGNEAFYAPQETFDALLSGVK